MPRGRAALGLLLLSSSLAAAPAQGAITFYDLFYNAYYSQTAPNAAPASADAFSVSARIIGTNGADLTQASVRLPNNVAYPLGQIADSTWAYFSNIYPSTTAMFADFAAGTYTYSISGGTLGSRTATLNRPVGNFFPAQVPFFTGDTFAGLAAVNPSAPLTLTITPWTPVPGATVSLTFVTIFDAITNAIVFDSKQTSAATSVVVPANTLQPQSAYIVAIYASSRVEVPSAGFSGATSTVGFDRVTSAFLQTTTGCLIDFNRDGFANLDDLGDFITDYYSLPPIPAGLQPAAPQYPEQAVGYGQPCPDAPNAPAPYSPDAYRTQGYRVGFSPDGSNACPLSPEQAFPNLDNLGDYITAFYSTTCN
jgi:hypothetical protein